TMGAWGYNYFENDAALDYMADIETTDDPVDMVEDIFAEALHGEYLDSDTGNAVVVAAAYVDRQMHGTSYSASGSEEILDIDTFFERNPGVNFAPFRAKAVQALRKVIGEGSELLEEWTKNGTNAPHWRKSIEDLIARLDEGRAHLRIV
ncbi:MAG: DUF4259 domain-containing protein, partial [Chitinophagaceae bacterium]